MYLTNTFVSMGLPNFKSPKSTSAFISNTINFPIRSVIFFSAPAIRVIDEQGHEVHDRYYKIGSTIDLTCQVATSFLMNSSAAIAPEPNNLLQYPINAFKQKSLNGVGGATANVPVAANTKPSSSNADSSFYKKIVWRKDGEKLQMDATINIR